MTVQIDDAVAANLKAAATLVDQLQKNPQTRRGLLGLIKQANPNMYVAELDQTKPLEDKIAALEKRLTERDAENLSKSQNAELAAARAQLRKDFGYTDEGIKELEKFMLDTNTADHRVAHDALQARKPKESPLRSAFNVSRMIDETDKDDADWLANPEAKLDRELNKAFDAIATGMAG